MLAMSLHIVDMYSNFRVTIDNYLFITKSCDLVSFQSKKFTTIAHIPKEYLSNGVRLHGHVTEIGPDGILHVDHIPLYRPRILSRFYKGT